MKVIVDQDPDYEGFYSIFTDMDAINVELAGKIGERKIADYLAKALENFELSELTIGSAPDA
jgi:hypothetical protein